MNNEHRHFSSSDHDHSFIANFIENTKALGEGLVSIFHMAGNFIGYPGTISALICVGSMTLLASLEGKRDPYGNDPRVDGIYKVINMPLDEKLGRIFLVTLFATPALIAGHFFLEWDIWSRFLEPPLADGWAWVKEELDYHIFNRQPS